LGLFFLVLILLPSPSYATPEYAGQTGFACLTCHIDATGGKLTKAGEEFRGDLKTRGLYRPLKPFQRVIRFIIGYLHLLMAIAWFGTILYVHILLKPAYAAKGLPKGELILGWLGIIILSITGVLLTISRMPTWETFYTTRFGILLGLKIILFSIMVSTAITVTFFIGPKMRRKRSLPLPPDKNKFTPDELSHFDGKEGRPVYFAYQGKIYNATSSKLWKDGNHVKKHPAGNDLTDLLKTAPHGEEKILQMPVVGELLPVGVKMKKSTPEKVFYFMAYMNLIFVFLITFIIALWRWW
jgi:predicted heme/steroid binding protein